MTEKSTQESPQASGAPPAVPVLPAGSQPSGGYTAQRYSGYGGYYGGTADAGILGSLHMSRLVRVLRRKLGMILLVEMLTIAGVLYYLHVAPRIYRASGLVEMSLRRPRIMNQQGALIEDQSYMRSEEVFNTRLKKFNSGVLTEAARVRLRQQAGSEKMSDSEIAAMLGGVSFNLVPDTRIVQVVCEKTDPNVAAVVANAYAEAAEASAVEENRIASDKAIEWLREQARLQREALEKAEKAVVDFRSENNLDILENDKKALEEAVMSLNRQVVEVEGQQVMLRDMAKFLGQVELAPESAGKVPDTVPRADEIRVALQEWTAAISDREALLIRYMPKHPEVEAKDRAIQLLKEQVSDAVRRSRQTAESNLALLEVQARSLRDKVNEQSKRISELESQVTAVRSRLASLSRERDACDVSYRGILNRIEEAKLSADENTATIKVVERAQVPVSPVSPQVKRIWLLGVLLGGLAGLVIALVTDTVEDYIVSISDVEQDLGLKVFGFLPHVERVDRPGIATAAASDKFSKIAESFAGVRSLLKSSSYRDSSHVVLVASTIAGEGKTITASNLAIAFAQSGEKTLLIDFDLRRPRVAGIFRMPDTSESLIHVLNARDPALFEKLPFNTEVSENLEVIASRVAGDLSAAEVLGNRFVRDFIAWARGRYARVVIDSPPFGIVSDAVTIAELSDCVLLVCRPEHSRKRAISHAMRQFSEIGAKVVGAVINDVDFEKGRFFGYEHYYYGYYYGYKTGDEGKKRRSRRHTSARS